MMRHFSLWGLTLLVFTASSPARADCAAYQVATNFHCVPEQCVFVMETSAYLPTELKHRTTGTLVPLDVLTLSDGRTMMAASQNLLTGDHDLVGVNLQATGFSVTVKNPPAAFHGVRATGRYEPSSGCRDSLAPPHLERETAFGVRVELGRVPLPDTRADLWFLQPGEAVPAGPPKVFALASPPPNLERVGDVYGEQFEKSFRIQLFDIPQGADRVAIQVMETTGERTGVLVVSLDDERGWYVACACARSAPSSVPAGLLLLAFVSLRRRH
jgi:hypothetical protein